MLNEKLQFTMNLLENMRIPCHLVTDPKYGLGYELDRGLRELLFGESNYTRILFNSLSQAQPNTVYRFFDEHHCCYIFMQLPESESYFFIGPYLLFLPSASEIRRKLETAGRDPQLAEQLSRYYAGLPMVNDENMLLTIACTLADELYSKKNYRLEYIEYMIPDQSAPTAFSKQPKRDSDSQAALSALEERYASEKLLMESVAQGKLHSVTTTAASFYLNASEKRLDDSLRDRKNYLIIFNTLLRKAAEYGKVHPIHIDRISAGYAKEIEALQSESDAAKLMDDMIRSYCLLVQNQSLRNYSDLVGRAITIIHFDLNADLSLKILAKQLNVTPSYLSAVFKKECGCTLTDYVNDRRLDYALHLLTNTNMQIQNVAFESGIQDVNYFIRLFKRRTGLTPTQYRKQIGKI